MRKLILALVGLVVVAGPIVALTAPANAATSSAPTMYASNVARGHTIPVHINAHGSKVPQQVQHAVAERAPGLRLVARSPGSTTSSR